MQTLSTAAEVIEALGGPGKLSRMTGRKSPSAAANWRKFGVFPSDTADLMREKLAALGYHAPPSLWGMVEEQTTEAAE